MYKIPIYKLSLVRDGSQKAITDKVNDSCSVAGILQHYLQGVDREHFVVLLLGTKNQLLGINTVSIGTLNASIVHPREVFKPAIIANANAIILGHNHPSGDSNPSPEDRALTKRLVRAGELLGIAVLDHVIIGSDYFSFAENGMLK